MSERQDLVAFVEARLADDERIANACHAKEWTLDGKIVGGHPTDEIVDWVYDEGGWEHIPRHDPARVLREVESNRELLQYCAGELADDESSVMPAVLLAKLAAVWSSHPDFRTEWSPGDE